MTATRTAEAPRPSRFDVAQVLLGLLGALTILAGASSLLIPLEGTSWVAPLLQVVGIIWLVGVLCRIAGSPAPVTVLVQVAGALLSITSQFSTRGYFGLIPNMEVADQFGAMLGEAWDQILITAPPAPSTPELSFLIVLTVGMTALITDFLVVEARACALVALPLLCLYSVPASIVEDLLPWWTFALPAAMYVLLLAASGHRGRATAGARLGLVITTLVAATAAISVSLVVADSVESVGTAGRIPRTDGAGNDIGLSPFTSLHGDLRRRVPVDYLSVTGQRPGDYLRTLGLETWTNGQGWSLGDLSENERAAGTTLDVPPLTAGNGETPTTALIDVINFRDRYLPLYSGTVGIDGLDDNWFLDVATRAVFRNEATSPASYELLNAPPNDDPVLLAADTVSPDPRLLELGDLPQSVSDLARDVTADGNGEYERAILLEQFFTDGTNGFEYSLTVPTGNSGDALVDFLELRRGYCEQYASAMAVMLRSLGIPARVAIGFTGGEEQADGSVLITSHEAHAWVEVRFDQAGWVRFDPTPLVEGDDPDPQSSIEETTGGDPSESTVTSTTPSSSTATSTTTITPTVTIGSGTAGGTGSADAGAVGGSGRVWATIGWVLAALLGVGLLVGLLAVPAALRRRRRQRRLAVVDAGGQDWATAAWEEVEDLALDHGITFEPAQSIRSAANRLARTGQLADRAREGLREITLATERAWYAAPAAAGPTPPSTGSVPPAPGSSSIPTAVADGTAADSPADVPLTHRAAVELIRHELEQTMPLTRWDRWYPRSLRHRRQKRTPQ